MPIYQAHFNNMSLVTSTTVLGKKKAIRDVATK